MEINISKKTTGIYCIKNTINKKIYIGSSVNIYNRLMKHRSLLRSGKHENRHLSNSWDKNGEKSFECFLIEECTKELLLKKEQFWIDKFDPKFNLIKTVKGNILSEDSKKLISETLKFKYNNGEIKPTRTSSIDCYDLNLNYICTYSMIRDASQDLDISESLIGRVLNGTYEKAKGYVFSYKGDKPVKPKGKKGHKLVFTNEYENLEFVSYAEAGKHFKVHASTIHSSYKRKQSYKNYNIKKQGQAGPVKIG